MENLQAMSWFNFESALKKISPRLKVIVERPVAHPQYPDLALLGIYYGYKHICGVTFDAFVPYRDLYDDKGILTHRGLKTILKYLLTAEFVPKENSTSTMPKRFQGSYFKPEISIDKIKEAFGVTEGEVLYA